MTTDNERQTTVIIPTAYWGPVQQYAWMLHADKVLVEQQEHYNNAHAMNNSRHKKM